MLVWPDFSDFFLLQVRHWFVFPRVILTIFSCHSTEVNSFFSSFICCPVCYEYKNRILTTTSFPEDGQIILITCKPLQEWCECNGKMGEKIPGLHEVILAPLSSFVVPSLSTTYESNRVFTSGLFSSYGLLYYTRQRNEKLHHYHPHPLFPIAISRTDAASIKMNLLRTDRRNERGTEYYY